MTDFVSDEESYCSSDANSATTDYDNIDLYNDCYVEDNTAYYFERDGINEDDDPPTIGNFELRTNKAVTLMSDLADSFLLECAKIEYQEVVENAALYSMQVKMNPNAFDLFDLFFNSAMAINMIKWVQDYSPGKSDEKITREEMLGFILVDLKLQYHSTSATHMYQKTSRSITVQINFYKRIGTTIL